MFLGSTDTTCGFYTRPGQARSLSLGSAFWLSHLTAVNIYDAATYVVS